MTSSIREKITLAVVALVQPTTGLSGRVWRSRQEAFSRASAPAVVVEAVSSYLASCKTDTYTLPIVINGSIRSRRS
jgi:hypothetical protein